MKTDAIRSAIDIVRNKLRLLHEATDSSYSAQSLADACEAELSALETALAATEKALREAEDWADRVSRAETMRAMVAGFVKDHGLLAACPVDFAAALSPPTGKEA